MESIVEGLRAEEIRMQQAFEYQERMWAQRERRYLEREKLQEQAWIEREKRVLQEKEDEWRAKEQAWRQREQELLQERRAVNAKGEIQIEIVETEHEMSQQGDLYSCNISMKIKVRDANVGEKSEKDRLLTVAGTSDNTNNGYTVTIPLKPTAKKSANPEVKNETTTDNVEDKPNMEDPKILDPSQEVKGAEGDQKEAKNSVEVISSEAEVETAVNTEDTNLVSAKGDNEISPTEEVSQNELEKVVETSASEMVEDMVEDAANNEEKTVAQPTLSISDVQDKTCESLAQTESIVTSVELTDISIEANTTENLEVVPESSVMESTKAVNCESAEDDTKVASKTCPALEETAAEVEVEVMNTVDISEPISSVSDVHIDNSPVVSMVSPMEPEKPREGETEINTTDALVPNADETVPNVEATIPSVVDFEGAEVQDEIDIKLASETCPALEETAVEVDTFVKEVSTKEKVMNTVDISEPISSISDVQDSLVQTDNSTKSFQTNIPDAQVPNTDETKVEANIQGKKKRRRRGRKQEVVSEIPESTSAADCEGGKVQDETDLKVLSETGSALEETAVEEHTEAEEEIGNTVDIIEPISSISDVQGVTETCETVQTESMVSSVEPQITPTSTEANTTDALVPNADEPKVEANIQGKKRRRRRGRKQVSEITEETKGEINMKVSGEVSTKEVSGEVSTKEEADNTVDISDPMASISDVHDDDSPVVSMVSPMEPKKPTESTQTKTTDALGPNADETVQKVEANIQGKRRKWRRMRKQEVVPEITKPTSAVECEGGTYCEKSTKNNQEVVEEGEEPASGLELETVQNNVDEIETPQKYPEIDLKPEIQQTPAIQEDEARMEVKEVVEETSSVNLPLGFGEDLTPYLGADWFKKKSSDDKKLELTKTTEKNDKTVAKNDKTVAKNDPEIDKCTSPVFSQFQLTPSKHEVSKDETPEKKTKKGKHKKLVSELLKDRVVSSQSARNYPEFPKKQQWAPRQRFVSKPAKPETMETERPHWLEQKLSGQIQWLGQKLSSVKLRMPITQSTNESREEVKNERSLSQAENRSKRQGQKYQRPPIEIDIKLQRGRGNFLN